MSGPRCSKCQVGYLQKFKKINKKLYLKCEACERIFDENLLLKPSLLFINEKTTQGQDRIKDVSRKVCNFVIQYVSREIIPYVRSADAIPILWGTNARLLYSPKSDIDIYVITPENELDETKQLLARFERKRKWFKLQRIITDYALKDKLPQYLLQEKLKITLKALSKEKMLTKIFNGMHTGIARAYQTPQQILISASIALSADKKKYNRLRKELIDKYRDVAHEYNVLLEHLLAALYLFNILSHIYYGLKRPESKGLPRLPPTLRFRKYFSNVRFTLGQMPAFKSLAFREWQFENFLITRDNLVKEDSKTLYRCLCDFLPCANALTKGRLDFLEKETFEIIDDPHLFTKMERQLCYKIILWRLAKLETVRRLDTAWKIAGKIADIALKKIARYQLEKEARLAKRLFIDSPEINYDC